MSFDGDFLSQLMATQLSPNEVNNIVYSLLKFSLRIDNPNNADIAQIMVAVVDNATPDNIIDRTIEFVQQRYGLGVTGTNTAQLERHMRFVIDEFMKMPQHLREDLGVDKTADEFTDKR